jgi:MHS family proline/betaine transporter-like MFS transporter
LAPILLTALRMVQGLSVGGEYTTSVVFIVESAPKDRRGIVGALACCGALAGVLMGSATGAALGALLTPEALAEWGWRIPFLMGLAVGLAGFLVRRHIAESAPTARSAESPFRAVIANHRALLLRLAGLSVFNAVGFYVMFVYIVSWLQMTDGMPPARALEINSFVMTALIPIMLAMGALSDRIGRRPVLFLGLAVGLVGAWPFLSLMHHSDPALVILGQLGFALAIGAFLGAQPAAMVEAAPEAVRCTAIALGYNVCLGIVGGLSPLAATWLVRRTGDDLSPAFLIMAAALVSAVAVRTFTQARAPQ